MDLIARGAIFVHRILEKGRGAAFVRPPKQKGRGPRRKKKPRRARGRRGAGDRGAGEDRGQEYFFTISAISAQCSSMSRTSLNWVRQRSRFWPSRWVRK